MNAVLQSEQERMTYRVFSAICREYLVSEYLALKNSCVRAAVRRNDENALCIALAEEF